MNHPDYGKELALTYLIMLFLGVWGMHRFYNTRFVSGILYLCTGAFCGLGILFDIFYNPKMVADHLEEQQ